MKCKRKLCEYSSGFDKIIDFQLRRSIAYWNLLLFEEALSKYQCLFIDKSHAEVNILTLPESNNLNLFQTMLILLNSNTSTQPEAE